MSRLLEQQSGGGARIPRDVVLPSVLTGFFLLQCAAQYLFHADGLLDALVLAPSALAQGRWWTLVTHAFLHAGILHLFMNAMFASVVAPPVLRALSGGPFALVRFAAFFLVCAVLSGVAFVLMNLGADRAVLGASGALSGLCGAAIRANMSMGDLAHPFAPRVWRASLPFLLVNVVLMGMLSFAGLPIAWQAHLGGFLAGLLLFGFFLPRRPVSAEGWV
jgi:membrane associated rhomboid family serine protease